MACLWGWVKSSQTSVCRPGMMTHHSHMMTHGGNILLAHRNSVMTIWSPQVLAHRSRWTLLTLGCGGCGQTGESWVLSWASSQITQPTAYKCYIHTYTRHHKCWREADPTMKCIQHSSANLLTFHPKRILLKIKVVLTLNTAEPGSWKFTGCQKQCLI